MDAQNIYDAWRHAIEEERALLDETVGRERNAEENTKMERIEADIVRLKDEYERVTGNEQRAAESATLREAQYRAFGEPTVQAERNSTDQLRSFLAAAMAGQKVSIDVNIEGARREKELLRSGASSDEIRALAWDTGSSGSLVPSSVSRTLYEYLEASNGIMRIPANRFTTASGEAIPFPKLGAHAIATQVSGQGTTLAGTDPSFLKMTLDAYKYGELVIVANELMTDGVVDIGSFLGRDMGRAIGRILATAYVLGTGSGQPQGIVPAIVGSGTIATGGSLVTPTVEKFIDLLYSVNDEYRNDPSAAWLMNDSTAGTARKLRDGAGGTVGAFLWAPSLVAGVSGGVPATFLDYPVYTDSNVAAQGSNAKTVVFGAWNAFYIRTVGNVTVESDQSRYFDTDQTGFRVKTRTDSDVIDLTAFNVIKQSV
jgi:HK97 family phage major capsid protein